MSLLESRRKLEDAKRYLSLNTDLEKTVGEDLGPLLKLTRGYLERSVQHYGEMVISEEKALRLAAQAEGEYSSAMQRMSGTHSPSELTELDKKSDGTRIREYFFEMVKNAALGVLSFPFSKKSSLEYRRLARIYASTLKTVTETRKINQDTERTRQQNLSLLSELEQRDAELSSRLRSRGLEEKTADSISLDPDSHVYGFLDSLKNRY